MGLQDITGVGPAYEETLEDAGYETIDDVATADPDDIEDKIDRADGAELVQNARDELDTDPTGPETVTFDPDFTTTQIDHTIRALVEQEVRQTRRNRMDAQDRIRDAIAELKSGPPFEFTREQVSDLYTGTNQLEQTYRSDPNVNDLAAPMREVKQFFNDARASAFE